MRLPEKLMGYVEYEGVNYPFNFDKDSFMITLFPPSIEHHRHTNSLAEYLVDVSRYEKKHMWVQQRKLFGRTSENYHIVFNVADTKRNYNGFFSFSVIWYCCYVGETSLENIDGMKIASPEVDYFYSSRNALEQSAEIDENTGNLKELSVAAKRTEIESGGAYSIAPDVDARIEFMSYAVMHFSQGEPAIDAKSEMVTSFSRPIGIDALIPAVIYAKCFLKYITYRTNVKIGNVEIFRVNGAQKREQCGYLVFEEDYQEEISKKAYERVIDFTILGSKTAEIFTAIKDGKFDFQYMCESLAATGNYSTSRAIMILAECEREYTNIFGQDYKRSREYQETKRELLDTMQVFIEQRQGRSRRYARQFYHAIESHDVGFGERLKTAMAECQAVMEPFIRSRYDGALDVTIEEICDRMNTVRNGIAHSRLDLNLEAIHLSDLKIIEELLYAMRFQYLHIDSRPIRIGIKKLFGENIAVE